MSNNDVKLELEKVEKILNATFTAITNMKDGERIQLQHLAETVGLAVAMTPKEVLPYVSGFAHRNTLSYVSRGKNGGLIKGQKSDKPVKKTKKSDTDSSDSSSN